MRGDGVWSFVMNNDIARGGVILDDGKKKKQYVVRIIESGCKSI